jgi:hypothetical protein
MTDDEFDLLDELYFVKTFDELSKELKWGDEELRTQLFGLIAKQWVKCMIGLLEYENPTHVEYLSNYANYQYIATKNGLLAHNRK